MIGARGFRQPERPMESDDAPASRFPHRPGGEGEDALAAAIWVKRWLWSVSRAPDAAGVWSADGADLRIGGGFPTGPELGFDDAVGEFDVLFDHCDRDSRDLVEDALARRVVTRVRLVTIRAAREVAGPADWHGLTSSLAYFRMRILCDEYVTEVPNRPQKNCMIARLSSEGVHFPLPGPSAYSPDASVTWWACQLEVCGWERW